jgi:hypothetical protein
MGGFAKIALRSELLVLLGLVNMGGKYHKYYIRKRRSV